MRLGCICQVAILCSARLLVGVVPNDLRETLGTVALPRSGALRRGRKGWRSLSFYSITYVLNYLLKFLVRVRLEVVGSESWASQALYFLDLKVLGAHVFHGRVGQEILDVPVVFIRTGRKDRHVRLQLGYLFFEGVPFLLNISECLFRVTPFGFKGTTALTLISLAPPEGVAGRMSRAQI
jgi:hypothetical protein